MISHVTCACKDWCLRLITINGKQKQKKCRFKFAERSTQCASALSLPEEPKKKKNFHAYVELRQGHLHIPYAHPNLISPLTTIKSDKWQWARYTEGSYRQTCGRHPASRTNRLWDYSPARLSPPLLRVSAAQYESVSVTPTFLMEM